MGLVMITADETYLLQLLARVEAGEDIVLARGDVPMARLEAFKPDGKMRRFGALRGVVAVRPVFFEPLQDEEMALWEDGGSA
jgi:antitoxin (DNA-binding transcriptional repressor) of toxin-antitoxin stability system